jgi:hypothetical protein
MTNMLEHPTVTVEREDGRIVSAYVELRRGVKAAGTVRPNPAALVYLLVAQDGSPIGIRLLEPVSGAVALEIVDAFVENPSGRGAEGRARHRSFLRPGELGRFLSGFKEGLRALEEETAA